MNLFFHIVVTFVENKSRKKNLSYETGKTILFDCFIFYGTSTIVGYLLVNPFLCKKTVLFQTIRSCISKQFVSKTVLFQAIQFSQQS